MKTDVRKVLMDEISKLNKGKRDLKTSRVLVKAAAQVVYVDRLEIEEKVHELKTLKFVGKTSHV